MADKIGAHIPGQDREEEVLEKTILNLLQRVKADLERYEDVEDKHALLMEIKHYLEQLIQDETRLETVIVTRDREIEDFESLLMEKDDLEKDIEEEEKILNYFHIGFAKVIKDLRMAFAEQDRNQRDAIIKVTISVIDRLISIGQHILSDEDRIEHEV